MIDRTRPHRATDSGDRSDENAFDELSRLLGMEVQLEAVLGEKRVPLGDLSGTGVGSDLLLLPRDRPVTLFASGVEIGEGTTVEVDGRLALRIDRMRPIAEVAAELGGRLREEI